MAQVIIGIIVTIILGLLTFYLYKKRKNERPDLEYYDRMSMDRLLKIVKIEMSEMVRQDTVIFATDINYEAIIRNKRRVEKALTDSVYGIDSARKIVIALIRDVLERELTTMEDVLQVYEFNNLFGLPPMVKFEILLYRLNREYGLHVLDYIEDKYSISAVKEKKSENRDTLAKTREFDSSKLDTIFSVEVESGEPLTYNECLDVIAILLYQRYHGFGCIDTLRTLKIDGMNFGTSGSIRYEIEGNYDAEYRSVNSVWVQVHTKWVHFSFLDFYKMNEMKRVINQLVSYGVTAPMTEKVTTKVADMYDGSRVTALRPPSAECYACFIRKFSLGRYNMQSLLERPGISNSELPIKLIYYLMKAQVTAAFTGQQNTGKTTLMKSAIGYVDLVNIRVLEMSFELNLREIYENKNIITVKPTDYTSNSHLQDVLKKTDGWLSMVGEVAEDIVAARMIQFTLIGTEFTMFSHHGKDDKGLIEGLAHSLVGCGEYHDHEVAVSTVLDAIKHNIHLGFVNDIRCVEYISEIVKLDDIIPYPEIDIKAICDSDDKLVDLFLEKIKLDREHYTRKTDRIRFDSRKIIKFNGETMSYEPGEWYTVEMSERIISRLPKEERYGFMQFYFKWWQNKEVS